MRFIYSSVILVFSSFAIYAQELKPENIDRQRIQDSIIFNLSILRDTQELKPIKFNEKLDGLAEIQAQYCLNTSKITHLQDNKKYRTLLDRAKSLGITNAFFEEIIISIDQKKIYKSSNQSFSDEFFLQVLKNKTYHAALKNPSLTEYGISILNDENKTIISLVLASPIVFAKQYQTPTHLYHIKTTSSDKHNICAPCIKKLDHMPSDIFYDLTLIDGTLFFIISNETWFKELFIHSKDGVAIDIIRKSQFPCGLENVEAQSAVSFGYVLPPVYTKELYKNARVNEKGIVFIPVGEIPEEWGKEEIELNLLILQNNILCRYSTFFQVPFGKWQTLDLAFDVQTSSKIGSFESSLEKSMTFVVPFERGKSTFDSLDLKPLADSLRLAHYTIKKLEVTAYSSVEGSKKINLELQEKRASSIINAIRTYQTSDFEAISSSNENWTQFFEDIQNSSKSFLSNKTQLEIREYLKSNYNDELEEILAKHRKAIIQIELQKKQSFDTLTKAVLEKLIEDSLYNSTEEKYLLIDEVFLAENEELLVYLSDLIQNKMDWNTNAKTKLAVYQYRLDSTLLNETLKKISGFIASDGQNAMIQYNYYLLKLREWEANFNQKEPNTLLKKQIWGNTTIENSKLNRLKINYLILETAYYSEKQNYTQKNRLVLDVIKLLPAVQLEDEEKFRVAKYLAENHQYKTALDLLESSTRASKVHENLLFLYINLSIVDEKTTQKTDFRATLANASVVNLPRFCKLFDSSLSGGITFQLLRNKYLKRSYCDLCQ